MTNKIYIVAGERNMELAALRRGGLYVNVGQTTREVEDRLRDDDYKRKAAGGKWKVILQQDVGELTDKDIHPILKKHPRIYWDPNSNNTEEFLFVDDPGDGSVAKKTVIEILTPYCQSLLKKENENLQNRINALEEEVVAFSSLFGSQGIDLQKIQEIEQENERLKDSLNASNRLLAVEKDESVALKGYLQRYENKLKGELRSAQVTLLNTKRAAENDARWSLFKGALAGAAVVSIVSWFCWPQTSNEVPTCTPVPVAAVVAPAVVEPITAPAAPETKNPFLPYSSYNEWIDDPDNGDISRRVALMDGIFPDLGIAASWAACKAIVPAISCTDFQSRYGEAVRRAQEIWPTGKPVEAKADLFLKFETCVYGKSNSNHHSVPAIMKCNSGNEVEMKKCLLNKRIRKMSADLTPQETFSDLDYVYLTDASDCWKKTH